MAGRINETPPLLITLLVTVVTGAVLLIKTATSRLVLAGVLGGSVLSCALRCSTQEMAHQQAPLEKPSKKKKKIEKKKKRKDAKSRSVPSGEATAAVAVGSEAIRRGGQSNGLLVAAQSSAQQLMGGLLLSMQNGEGH